MKKTVRPKLVIKDLIPDRHSGSFRSYITCGEGPRLSVQFDGQNLFQVLWIDDDISYNFYLDQWYRLYI